MQYTTHYNLNLPEGSDIVNPLVQDNPNYSAIDTALYNNKLRVVGNATEVKSGTVHAITRSDSDIDVIRFTATGNWDTSDTMTVDGTPVSVYLPDGTAPLTGAYVINTEVIAVISGSRVTLYGAQKLPAYTASDVSYDNTGSGLAASDVQDAIDEVNSKAADLEANIISNTTAMTTALYTFPADGYLVFENAGNTSGSSNYGVLLDANGSVISPIRLICNSGDENKTVFVRKGMKFSLSWNLIAYTSVTFKELA